MDIEQKKSHFVCIFKNYRYICSRIKQKHNKKLMNSVMTNTYRWWRYLLLPCRSYDSLFCFYPHWQ